MIIVNLTHKESYQEVKFDYKPPREALERIKALGGRWEAPYWTFRMTGKAFEEEILPVIEEIAGKEEIKVNDDTSRAELAQLLGE